MAADILVLGLLLLMGAPWPKPKWWMQMKEQRNG
jgi:hypothetical protein